jgi:hypothetical protein
MSGRGLQRARRLHGTADARGRHVLVWTGGAGMNQDRRSQFET